MDAEIGLDLCSSNKRIEKITVCTKTYLVGTQWNCLGAAIPMSTRKKCFDAKVPKIIPNYLEQSHIDNYVGFPACQLYYFYCREVIISNMENKTKIPRDHKLCSNCKHAFKAMNYR